MAKEVTGDSTTGQEGVVVDLDVIESVATSSSGLIVYVG
jgi:hypothetical protein